MKNSFEWPNLFVLHIHIFADCIREVLGNIARCYKHGYDIAHINFNSPNNRNSTVSMMELHFCIFNETYTLTYAQETRASPSNLSMWSSVKFLLFDFFMLCIFLLCWNSFLFRHLFNAHNYIYYSNGKMNISM